MSRKKPLPITNGDEPVKTDLPLEDDFDDGEQAGDESVSGLEPLSFRLDDEVIGQRLDKVLSGLMPEFSRSRIQQWIEDGHVTVDGVFDTVMVDDLQPLLAQSNTVWCSYGPAPNSAWLIAQDGKVKLSQLWFDGPTMDDAMAAMTA